MKKGFTLVEILVTVAIIAILSAVVLASVSGARLKSRDARRVADIKQLQSAIQEYFSTCYAYPSSLSQLTTVSGCHASTLPTIPTDPKDKTGYSYYLSSTPLKFHLCSTKMESSSNTKGKAGVAAFNGSDPCNGSSTAVFDIVGGAY